jgi:hypothetical protein
MTQHTLIKFTDRENPSVSISSAARIYRAGLFCAGVTRSARIADVFATGSTPPTCTPDYAMARELKDCHLRPRLTALLFTAVLNTDWKKRKITLSGRQSGGGNPADPTPSPPRVSRHSHSIVQQTRKDLFLFGKPATPLHFSRQRYRQKFGLLISLGKFRLR